MIIRAFIAIVVVATAASQVSAQACPAKPLRLIVPSAAGSPPDIQARWLGDRLAGALGQPVVVENRPGAGGHIGARVAAESAPDGYTILYAHQGVLAFNPHLYAQPGYDALRLIPIARIGVIPLAVAVRPGLNAATLAELVRLAKEQPNKLTLGTSPLGAPPHLAGELFRRIVGIDVTLVPFKGSAIMEVVGGHVDFTLDIISAVLRQARAGKVRVLAVTSAKRVASLPDVPTFREAGAPDYVFETWAAYCVPGGTPASIVARLTDEIGKIGGSAIAREWTSANGYEPVSETQAALAAMVREEHAR